MSSIPPTTNVMPAGDDPTPEDLLAAVEEERERRWRIGDRVPAERLFQTHPALASGELAVQLIYGEFLLREEAGERPTVEEYQQRFPALAERLGRQILVHRAVASPSDTETLPSSGLNSARAAAAAAQLPHVPGFELIDELGRGGMAVVYRARDTRLNRVVALKFIKSGSLPGSADVDRFRTEAEAVARLRHAHIVQIYEVGEAEGVPYMALEYVPGGTLSARVRENPLSPRAAAELTEQLALALEAAHRAGVVHRDLKPGNVLLGADGSPRVVDFGLAKRTDAQEGHTHTGALLGTPSYMAPEQASGNAKAVGPPCDVYALGAILYECLTGRPPFRGSNLHEILQQVCYSDPVPPSRLLLRMPADLEAVCLRCLEKDPGKRYPSAAALAEDLRRWLDGKPTLARPVGTLSRGWKLIRRNPLISAATAVTAIALLVGGGLAAWFQVDAERERAAAATAAAKSEANAQIAKVNGQLADAAEKRAEAQSQAAESGRRANYSRLLALAERHWQANSPALAAEALDACPEYLRDWDWYHLRRLQQPDRGAFRAAWDEVVAAALSPDGKTLATLSGGKRDPSAIILWDAKTGHELVKLMGFGVTPQRTHTEPLHSVAFSPDGRTLVTASRSPELVLELVGSRSLRGEVLVWDVRTRQSKAHYPNATGPIAFSADGTRFAACCQGRIARVWDITDDGWKELPPLPEHPGRVTTLALSPDGRHLAVAGMTVLSLDSGNVRIPFDFGIYDAASGKKLPNQPECPAGVSCATFSSDGTTLAVGCLDGVARQWEVATGRPGARFRGHTSAIGAIAFSPNGKKLATGGVDQTVRVWDAVEGAELRAYRGHNRPVTAVMFLPQQPESEPLFSASLDGSVRPWNATRPADHLELAGHKGAAVRVAFSPDPEKPLLASLSRQEARVRFWDPQTGEQIGKPLAAPADQFAFGPGGLLATSDAVSFDKPGPLILWDVATRTAKHKLVGHRWPIFALAFSPDGRFLVTAGGNRITGETEGVLVWDTATGKQVRTLQPDVKVITAVAFSSDGKRLAAGGQGGLAIHDFESGANVVAQTDAELVVNALAFSRDGLILAVGDANGYLSLCNSSTGEQVAGFPAHRSPIVSLAFHRGSRRLASASLDVSDAGVGEVRVWDVPEGREVLTLPGELSVSFSPDGRYLAAPGRGTILGGERSHVVRVWDGGPFPLAMSLGKTGVPLFTVTADPTGQSIATSGSDGEIRLWDLATRKSKLVFKAGVPVSDLCFSPDGSLLVFAPDHSSADKTHNGWVRVWDLKAAKELTPFEGHTKRVARVRFDPTGTRLITTSFDRTVRVWDVASRKPLFPPIDHPEGGVVDLALSADGRRAASCSGSAIQIWSFKFPSYAVRLWDPTTGKLLRKIEPPGLTASVALGAGFLASGDADGRICVWDAETGEKRTEWKAHEGIVWGMAFTPKGVLISGGSDRMVYAWDPESGKPLGEYSGHLHTARRIIARDGWFASASFDGTVRLWTSPDK